MNFEQLLRNARIIPVLTVERVSDAVPLAKALVAGGIKVLEVTLRTEAAAEAAKAMMAEVPEAVVGLGTLTRPQDFERAAALGVAFVVSPGLTPALARAARDADLPFLPGTATVSEVLLAREEGFRTLKFFPASIVGGAPALKAMVPLVPDVAFCPTGGITASNASDYLSLPNVMCVGGTWIAPNALIDEGRWDDITALARTALAAV